MPDLDAKGGGGWTRVGQGIGGEKGCWGDARSKDCNGAANVFLRETYLYKDTTINGIPHTAIRFEGHATLRSPAAALVSPACPHAQTAATARAL